MTPRRAILFVLLLSLAAPGLFWPGAVFAQTDQESHQAIAERYVPVLFFHPAEIFRPQPVDVLVDTARLRAVDEDLNLLLSVTVADLLDYPEPSYALDAWYGDAAASDYKNYSAHRAYYRSSLAPEVGGPSPTVYARVVRDASSGETAIQYWFFYYYNDWFNKHEGDWELAQVVLDPSGQPAWLALAQHHGGTRRAWSQVHIEDGSHPAVFVALGSHAAYFTGDETYYHSLEVGSLTIEVVDRTGTAGRVIPEVVMLPESDGMAAFPGFEWLVFGGHWGEAALIPEMAGPLGPSHKGDKWERPFSWAFNRPLDHHVWYRNRLRVEVGGPLLDGAFITLHAPDGTLLPFTDPSPNPAILHIDPPHDLIYADIELPSTAAFSLTAVWPDPEAGTVTEYRFSHLPPAPQGRASVALSASAPPVLTIPSVGEFAPDTSKTIPAAWDAPDMVWMGGLLPAAELGRGVVISVLAAVLPALLFVFALYWADRYEKEPKRLLAAAFVWGALPALLVAFAVRIFFQLPPELFGPQAVEALRLGLLSPFIEEALKGAAVLFIARRYSREFDTVLDGMLYAAVVGFGFAMTGNLVSYLGAFLLRGFAGLSSGFFVQGLLFALNHALFTALFGAGLGYSRLRKTRGFRLLPLLAFAAAVIVNGLHGLALAYSLRPAIPAALFALAGLALAAALFTASLRRQWWVMARQLVDELPPQAYREVIHPRRRVLLLWASLRRGLSVYLAHRRRLQLAAELAFKKHQLTRLPADPDLLAEIQSLRKDLYESL